MKRLLWLCTQLILLPAQAGDSYDFDSLGTQMSFNVQWLGESWVKAHFREFSGSFVLDRRGTASRVDVTVQTQSVECDNWYWNARLRSTDWLDVKRYPQMTFHARRVEFEGSDRAIARGELTLRGVTRAVALNVSHLQCERTTGASASCRFVADAHVRRSDYGLPHGFWAGGDQVDILISGAGVLTGTQAAQGPAAGAAGK